VNIPDNAVPYLYSINWSTDVTAGNKTAAKVLIESDADFLIQRIRGSIYNTGVLLTSTVAYTPWPWNPDPSPGATGNTLPSVNSFRIEFADNDHPWQRSPVRWPHWVDPGAEDRPLITPILVKAGSTIYGTLYNDSGTSAQAEVVFFGLKLPRLRG